MKSLDRLDVAGRVVLLRADLNVPMQAGRVHDDLRIRRLLPTIRHLAGRGAKVVLLSHFGRPEGTYRASDSLSPLVDALQDRLPELRVRFGIDCIGPVARSAVERTGQGEVLLLENLRFHPEEEAGDPAFAAELAALGERYVNDAFSCAHRAHASVALLPGLLPSAVGLAFEEETGRLGKLLDGPERPLVAVVGGSKVSTKLRLLENLISRVDHLVIGGAMAHAFLAAEGRGLGRSWFEPGGVEPARAVIAGAKAAGCMLHLPVDLAVAESFEAEACRVVDASAIPETMMALDLGPRTMARLAEVLAHSRTLVWNGPLGAFERPPYDHASIQLARVAAGLTDEGRLVSIAGGGDTVGALAQARLGGSFSYLSTAGGAFLEWLEGRSLPGIEALRAAA